MRRGGEQVLVPNQQIVVGDVIILQTGDKITADGVVIESNNLVVDEASLTGESEPIKKGSKDPFCRAGTTLSEGSGSILVVAVGVHTEYGKTMSLVMTESASTPLQEHLEVLATSIGKVGLAVAVVCFSVLLIRWCIQYKGFPVSRIAEGPLAFFIFGVTIVVVAVPEGLPLAVTISLAYSMKKMMKDNNFVRVLAACETMGGATAICSDKTGTLTENRMTVVEGWFAGKKYNQVPQPGDLPAGFFDMFQANLAVNSSGWPSAFLHTRLCPKVPTVFEQAFLIIKDPAPIGFVGNRTECALLMLLRTWDADYTAIREKFAPMVEKVWDFDSAKKMASVLIRTPDGYRLEALLHCQALWQAWMKAKSRIVFILTHRSHVTAPQQRMQAPMSLASFWFALQQGAAEIVLRSCSKAVSADGGTVPLDSTLRSELEGTTTDMAARGLRTLCITYRDFPSSAGLPADSFETPPDSELICCAITGIKASWGLATIMQKCLAATMTLLHKKCEMLTFLAKAPTPLPQDPVRKEVPDAVAVCKRAGIFVRMVTGDNVHTASHIARECGIMMEGGLALEGPTFRKMTEEELIPILPKLQVMARSSPTDKYNLVKLLKKTGEVVAVTGDGTNDAPALKESDVGLAMGIAGTEVAKEAADIVIMDDNFSSIVKSVLWGRSVFANLRKFLQFQLTVNFVALVLSFVAAISNGETPLTVIQLLWVNLIMDALGALALATEAPTPDLLLAKPHGRKEPIINRSMWKHIFTQGFYQLFWLFLIIYGANKWIPRYALPNKCATFARLDLNFDDVQTLSSAATQTGGLFDTCCSGTNCYRPNGGIYLTGEIPLCDTSNGRCVMNDPSKHPQLFCTSDSASSTDCQRYKEFHALYERGTDQYVRDTAAARKKANSVVFNTFIFMQIFNQINARKIKDEYNPFGGLGRGAAFVYISLIEVILQGNIRPFPTSIFAGSSRANIKRHEFRHWPSAAHHLLALTNAF
ncbi:hypothetical protein ABBQ38_005290 [Trebouxia sp. C0009 RCD-2024]